MKFYDSGKQLTGQDLSDLEDALGQTLPADYKDFMLKANGGTPKEDLAFNYSDVTTNRSNDTDLRELFILYKEEHNDAFDDILRIYNSMVDEKLIPPFFLPIGDDSGGNPICMNLFQEEYGSVWFCDHELENMDTGFLATSKVANSFTDFINSLYPLVFEE